MKVWITGGDGFVGSHLREMRDSLAQAHGMEIEFASGALDLRDRDSIASELAGLRADGILHLAAQSNVAQSFDEPEATFDVNAAGTVRLLCELERIRFAGRFLYVSSGDVYGTVLASDLPVDESVTPRAANPYSASKLAAEAAALAWGRCQRFDVIVARPFNHVGARQSESFALARFASRLATIGRQGLESTLTTGRLDVTRDFLDVRDVIAAYALLLQRGRAGEIYNVCSGVERALGDVLQALIEISGVSATPTMSSDLLRPIDLPRMVGSAAKLAKDTGWRPVIPFEQTLLDLYRSFVSDPA